MLKLPSTPPLPRRHKEMSTACVLILPAKVKSFLFRFHLLIELNTSLTLSIDKMDTTLANGLKRSSGANNVELRPIFCKVCGQLLHRQCQLLRCPQHSGYFH